MTPLFNSFYLGGFECATHRRRDRRQIDVIEQTAHDRYAAADYTLLSQVGIKTVRDGLRWHLIEQAAGVYDWSSFVPMLEASLHTQTQVVWDLCHWGVPEGLDVFSNEFVTRFAAFAGAAAEQIKQRSNAVPFFCPVNEMSFWAWVGGDVETFHPHRSGEGDALKRQLVRASLAAVVAVRAVDARARFVQAEPLIHVVAEAPDAEIHAARYTESQFQAWDMLRGDMAQELGGSPGMLDIIGVNYYWNNQWVRGAERITIGHPRYKPLHTMLRELYDRYRRPILITETGAEAGADVGWLGYISSEVRQAQREGVPVEGICLYPVMDYPGWDDDRHCRCGLISVDEDWRERSLRQDLAAELRAQQAAMNISVRAEDLVVA